MNTLRLLLFKECNRSCDGCCNKDWDLESLPIIKDYSRYDEVVLTGGEPMLNPGLVNDVIMDIRTKNKKAKVILYTAKTDNPCTLSYMVTLLDGLTVTLHDQGDVDPFVELDRILDRYNRKLGSIPVLRVNIFSGVNCDKLVNLKCKWNVKSGMEWIKNCPLPPNETFGRLNITKQLKKDYFENGLLIKLSERKQLMLF